MFDIGQLRLSGITGQYYVGSKNNLNVTPWKDKLLKLLETKGGLPPLSDVLISLEGRINNSYRELEVFVTNIQEGVAEAESTLTG